MGDQADVESMGAKAMTKPSRYARDPAYPEPPNWDKLYRSHFAAHTCPASRHVALISGILRDEESSTRRFLFDTRRDPNHWASSMEATVKALWEARARLAELEPKG